MPTPQIDREFEKKHIGRTLECYKRTFAKKIEARVNKYLSKLRVTILLTTNRLNDEDLTKFSKNLEDYMFEFEDDFDSHLNNHVQLVRNRLNVGHIDVSFTNKKIEESEFDFKETKETNHQNNCFAPNENFEFDENQNFFGETEPIFEERVFIQPQRQCNGLFQVSEPEERIKLKPNTKKRRRRKLKKPLSKPLKKIQKKSQKYQFMKKTVFMDDNPISFWKGNRDSEKVDYPVQEEQNYPSKRIIKSPVSVNSSDEEDMSPFIKPRKLGKRNQEGNYLYHEEIDARRSRPKKSIKLGEMVKVNLTDVKPQIRGDFFKPNKQIFGKSLSKESESFNPTSTGNLFDYFHTGQKFKKVQSLRKEKVEKGKSGVENGGKMDKPSEAEPSIFSRGKNLGKF